MGSLTSLPASAEAVLAAFAGQLEALDVDVPERRAVVPGSLVVFDGEQLTVNLQQILQGQPGAPSLATFQPAAATVMSVQWAITLVRLAPVGEAETPFPEGIPTAEVIGEAGGLGMQDAAALIRAAIAIHGANTLTRPGEGFAIDGCAPLGPEGGVFATRLLITLSLS